MMQQTTLTTLRAIHTAVKSGSVKGDSASFSTLGLIIDCANPHRKDPKKDYLMRVKIFDPSISINEPVTIFLYAREVRDFPSDIAVGDVLYLNKYNFEIWNDTLQAKRGFKVPDSFSRFFTGDS